MGKRRKDHPRQPSGERPSCSAPATSTPGYRALPVLAPSPLSLLPPSRAATLPQLDSGLGEDTVNEAVTSITRRCSGVVGLGAHRPIGLPHVDERLEPQRRRVRVRRPTVGQPRCLGVARQPGGEHRLRRAVERLHRAFKCGVYPGRSAIRTANTAHAAATVPDRKSLPPIDPDHLRQPTGRAVRLLHADRRAQRRQDALPAWRPPGVTAVPNTMFAAVSTNQVTHGFTNRPSMSTSTGASTWSASHAWVRAASARRSPGSRIAMRRRPLHEHVVRPGCVLAPTQPQPAHRDSTRHPPPGATSAGSAPAAHQPQRSRSAPSAPQRRCRARTPAAAAARHPA